MITVRGHRLAAAGAAYGGPGCAAMVCLAYGLARIPGGGSGHGVCECGERSPHLSSNRERREWHRAHKAGLATAA